MKDTFKHKGLRQKLVETIKAKGITNSEVLEAIGSIPRHLFMDSGFLDHAYQDKAFPIAAGQTISQPYTVAYQTELLAIKKGDKVLEIGTGSGYQCAVLCKMGAKVYTIERQLELFKQRAEFQEVEVHHVKPHGALYNLIAVDAVKAQLVVDVIKEVFGKMMIYVPYNSKIEKVALNNKLPVFYEAFADRNYNDDLSLVSRTESNAVLVNSNEVVEHVFRILEGNVLTVQENLKPIKADTLCIHGDNPNVLKILKSLHQHFN